jgi:predicted amidohydrolase
LRVTVCQLSEDRAAFTQEWDALLAHIQAERTDLLLLPEMIFSPWLAAEKPSDFAAWTAAADEHQRWIAQLERVGVPTILGAAPVIHDGQRLNEGFIWDNGGYHAVHHKYYLPDEDGFWEAHWYQRGDKTFQAAQTAHACIGFMICSELWFLEHARAYGRQGVQLLATPRATEQASVAKWLIGGQTAAIVSGAFSLSSNRCGGDFGGQGWIVDPDGEVLGVTTAAQPFLTREIDLTLADRAKQTYPRYIPE